MRILARAIPLATAALYASASAEAFELSIEDWKKRCPVIASQGDLWTRKIDLKPLDKLDLRYPQEKVGSKEEGVVLVLARIDTHGIVVDLDVLQASDPAFVPSALEGLKRVRFAPILIDGKPACVEHTFEVSFEIPAGTDSH